jgi:ABC-type uncharacterized transport system permease subunit
LSVVLGSVIYFVVYQVVIALGMSGDDMKLITALIGGMIALMIVPVIRKALHR